MLNQLVALKLVFGTDLGGYWSTSRVVNDCNRVGRHVVSGESIGGFKFIFRPDLGKYWLTNGVLNNWNRLGEHAVSAESIGGFKTCIQEGPRWILTH